MSTSNKNKTNNSFNIFLIYNLMYFVSTIIILAHFNRNVINCSIIYLISYRSMHLRVLLIVCLSIRCASLNDITFYIFPKSLFFSCINYMLHNYIISYIKREMSCHWPSIIQGNRCGRITTYLYMYLMRNSNITLIFQTLEHSPAVWLNLL